MPGVVGDLGQAVTIVPLVDFAAKRKGESWVSSRVGRFGVALPLPLEWQT